MSPGEQGGEWTCQVEDDHCERDPVVELRKGAGKEEEKQTYGAAKSQRHQLFNTCHINSVKDISHKKIQLYMERLSFDPPQRKAIHSKSSNISFAIFFTARIFPWHKVFLVIKFGITFLEKNGQL